MPTALNCILIPPHRRVDLQEDFGGPDGIVRLATAAEDAGFWAVTCSDHLLVSPEWASSGGHHDLDPFSTLGFLAAVTQRVRLLTFVLVVAYRHPAQTAKSLATIDVLSKGRLVVGVGAGYLESEFAALGLEFEKRNRITDDSLHAVLALWADAGEGLVAQLPKPVQRPRPPIWIGGNSTRAMRRAVELGDGWLPFFSAASASSQLHTPALEGVDDLLLRVKRLREMEAEAGRKQPVELVAPMITVGDGSREVPGAPSRTPLASKEGILEYLSTMEAAGATSVCIRFTGRTVDEQVDQLDWFASDVIGSRP
jgi:probable F420-dependent oxidoreductase